jgi:hypothetical protein
MSQAGIVSSTAGPSPPVVPTQFTTDNGSIAIPVANNLNVLSNDTTDNNSNGIQTRAVAPNSDNLYVQLTNRITGTATTTDAVTTQTVYTFDMGATPATYLFEVRVVGYNVTNSLSAGYTSYRTVKTDGTTGTLISANPGIISEEGAMTGVLVTNGLSGNNLTLTVMGYNGDTIHWEALTSYIKVE